MKKRQKRNEKELEETLNRAEIRKTSEIEVTKRRGRQKRRGTGYLMLGDNKGAKIKNMSERGAVKRKEARGEEGR